MIDGNPGGILVAAVHNTCPVSSIKFLHDNGASFRDAMTTMHSRGYDQEDIGRLAFFEKELAGPPDRQAPKAAAEHQPPAVTGTDGILRAHAEIIRQMQENQRDLTEQVRALTAEVQALKTGKPAEEAEEKPAAAKTHAYPKAF
jgi:hypothetical protein